MSSGQLFGKGLSRYLTGGVKEVGEVNEEKSRILSC